MGHIYAGSSSTSQRSGGTGDERRMVHLSNVDLSSASESEDDRESSQYHNNRRSNMAAQRAATNNIIRIEMMGEKSKPIRMR